ncbi:alpha-ribazole phosphatase [Geomonas silvestris]|uniref:Alpha-ribazole phosphatase n=1 Tax=Geomonas silvestris TaxID=2740184 RepID=A0A6V8MFH2_9BACT|nr:histidine phosphatase family protein [Geomonas silvestris]GFO58563.1 alpha-ribazole phosphatase [Geomonas silvestris]
MTPKTRIHLIRHGEVERQCYNGHYDVGLTPRGVEQYHGLKPRLEPGRITALYTSDLTRTRRGGEILGAYLGVAPVALPELRELNCGAWEGLTLSEVQKQRPEEWAARLADVVNFRAPGGESLTDLAGRVLPVLSDLVEKHRGEEVLVVAHGGVNRIVLLDAIGAPLSSMFAIDQKYCALNIVDYYADGNRVVQLING